MLQYKDKKEKEKDNDKKGENEKDKLRSLEGTNLDALLQRLPGCVSRDLIDQLTVRRSYCALNLFLDCIVIFSSLLIIIAFFVELLNKILGGVLLSKFKIKSEKACEGFVQCTFKQLKTRPGGAILNLQSSPMNLMFLILDSMFI